MEPKWYAAHVLIVQRFCDGLPQDSFGVYENVYLVCANTDDEAFKKAEELGKLEEVGPGEGYTTDDRPTTWHSLGVRKLIRCPDRGRRPGDGDEVTYSFFEVSREDDLKLMVAGSPVVLSYEE